MAGEAISKAFSLKPDQDLNPPPAKKKRNLPGTPDPDAEVIALSPKTLMATNRFLCEICGKGFQRDQNLQLHRRGHNLPWKLRQRSTKEPRKRVYVCPEKTCIHHNPLRALGDLTGIKKHFCRKHGEKKWKCDKCSKRYAVQSDWKAHSKTCGTREYRCDCGTLFSRRDSFITHRAFCDALAEEAARVSAVSNQGNNTAAGNINYLFTGGLMRSNMLQNLPSNMKPNMANNNVEGIGQCRDELSLWMGHGSQSNEHLSNASMHHIGSMGGAATLHGDLFASNSYAQQIDQNQLSWLYSSKLPCSSNNGELTSTMKEATDGSQSLLASVPSLFSNQHQDRPPPMSDMSATALLQKAAQIGVTSTTPFEEHNKFDGLLSSSHPSSLENIMNEFMVANSYDMYSATRRHGSSKDDLGGGGGGGGGGGETRDFLGVGVQTLCPSSINGWI
ncbi:zinc finger protein MAGPIE-like [Typha angustifolia]|uniref:zinc finger protein MAGPIE-like n=1 Tax=Typha angustifolia TaxID=59011 RepID=UPI003C2BA7ED